MSTKWQEATASVVTVRWWSPTADELERNVAESDIYSALTNTWAWELGGIAAVSIAALATLGSVALRLSPRQCCDDLRRTVQAISHWMCLASTKTAIATGQYYPACSLMSVSRDSIRDIVSYALGGLHVHSFANVQTSNCPGQRDNERYVDRGQCDVVV
ncbi:hypothetical protein NEUTE1DRAFT_114511 [Neurospora tetrasperma FGSC 2508]|uniref:Uncharacterized protein n=1 Tax=Neurospora tetrasperma (strain FGSC 2508 / ATCC MYA-4615 / P0657) TaxID=510951 RepID=F8N350_NEUT8|nr:uncharacterized protein NEUTE1DRAFT_114511 [Neurospora tetrasperma FGSC 2508]EGO52561.1 hypothetical protein NEUTE1DRAFT_114511 [Neurospora tetrasperma FGSC 2508]